MLVYMEFRRRMPTNSRRKFGPFTAAMFALTAAGAVPPNAEAAHHPYAVTQAITTPTDTWGKDFFKGYWERLKKVGFDSNKLTHPEDKKYIESMRKWREQFEADTSPQVEADRTNLRHEVGVFKELFNLHIGHRMFISSLPANALEESVEVSAFKTVDILSREKLMEQEATEILEKLYSDIDRLFGEYTDLDSLAADIIATGDFRRTSQIRTLNERLQSFNAICAVGAQDAHAANGGLACDRALLKIMKQQDQLYELQMKDIHLRDSKVVSKG